MRFRKVQSATDRVQMEQLLKRKTKRATSVLDPRKSISLRPDKFVRSQLER